ncbi:NAD-dependent epimerase/dehydratase family protein [Microbulbifer sp. ARAS458-1]|uniref:NAD-dependent epimerase/dehydratase family protein n=1 Tax=Microbulbifer sp. ARAS458-1 TaxID=3140242 RepID=UPI003877DCCE
MRWVVVGSSGYIGEALCRYLVAAGFSVCSVSRQPFGPGGVSHRQVENYCPDTCAELFSAGDRVVFAAGLSSARDCRRHPARANEVNYQLPLAILQAAESAQAESFLYLSSVKAVVPPDGEIAGEWAGEPAPDVYGNSKWRAEQKLLASGATIRVNILRPAAVYGEYVSSAGTSGRGAEAVKAKRAYAWRQRFRAWGQLFPWVPATGWRSFVALEDLLSAIYLVVESNSDRETFIAAEPQFYDLARIASVASGRRIKSSRFGAAVLLVPARLLALVGVKTGFLDVQRSELYSSARIKNALNWRANRRYSQYLRGLDGDR